MGRLTIRIDGEAYIEKVANKYCEEVCSSRNRCNDCPIRDAFNKLAHYEDLEEQGLLRYPKPELNDCDKCGSLGEFGGCLFFGYGKDTEEQCRKRMAKLKEGAE